MIKAVVFDFDDTLIETFQNGLDNLRFVSEKTGISFPTQQAIREHYGKSWGEFVSNIWPEMEIKEFTEIFAAFQPAFKSYPAVKGAHEIIDLLSKHYVLGIQTGGAREHFLRNALNAKIDLKKFSFVITASENPLPKKDPKYFDLAFKELNKLGVDQKEVLFVGDSVFDYSLAQRAGIHFVGVLTGPSRKEELIAEGVEERMIIPSILELPQFIQANGFSR